LVCRSASVSPRPPPTFGEPFLTARGSLHRDNFWWQMSAFKGSRHRVPWPEQTCQGPPPYRGQCIACSQPSLEHPRPREGRVRDTPRTHTHRHTPTPKREGGGLFRGSTGRIRWSSKEEGRVVDWLNQPPPTFRPSNPLTNLGNLRPMYSGGWRRRGRRYWEPHRRIWRATRAGATGCGDSAETNQNV